MAFRYIWGLLECNDATPPSAEMFVAFENGYKFYPLQHTGRIFTFDERVWNLHNAHDKVTKTACTTIWPSRTQVEKIIIHAATSPFCMIAFSDNKQALTIEAGQTVELHEISTKVKNDFGKAFVDFGYDILDVSGISALTDIGYKIEEVQSFNSIKVNKYGLVSHPEEAAKLAALASQLAPEHAYFFPVNVWGLIGSKASE